MVRILLTKAGAEENQPELAIKALESDQVERIAAVSPVVARRLRLVVAIQQPARCPQHRTLRERI
jgi:hypothetical protein